ncbi:DNA sulfur modification protein DndD, partial [Nitrosarchaeum sp.]|uniref:DNA sulfur modification protein DndD n=1 Tax=Nitrosarchaeum sp. TaxID=2026886 RepID=UPI00247C92D5
KTTLFESIMLCLYGQNSFEQKITLKQYHASILRSIHRYLGTKKSADEASIIVEFQFAHEGKITEYQVLRMWQNNDGKVDEKLLIQNKEIDEENFSKLDLEESDWQTFIDQLLPKGITSLFFFDGEKIQSIADSGDEARHIKSSFDVLLGLDLVKQLSDDIGLTLLRNSDGETKKLLEELDKFTHDKNEAEEKLGKLQDKQGDLAIQIKILQLKASEQEEQFKKIGGSFANKKESLKIEKARLESKLENVEKEIRDLCSGVLPFSLIPNLMKQLKSELLADQKKIQDSFEKNILENTFKDLLEKINSKSFLPMYDDTVKENFSKQLIQLLENKLESISNIHKTTFNLSQNDMNQIIQLIDEVDKSSEAKIESLAKSHNVILNSLNLINVSLESTPKDDEIGTIFSKLTQTNRELGELENEMNHLKTLESQEKSFITILNAKIRNILTKRQADKRRLLSLELGPSVQDVLEEYSNLLRNKKLELLEENILKGLDILLHKKDFIDKVSIDRESFEITLYKGEDEITKEMLSKGELQMYATAVVWGLAKTSDRPLPFMIDTPLARLDDEHRENVVENFYPLASHQTIIFSTNSEINFYFYKKLESFIANSFVIKYESSKGKTVKYDGYFFNEKGEKIIEV